MSRLTGNDRQTVKKSLNFSSCDELRLKKSKTSIPVSFSPRYWCFVKNLLHQELNAPYIMQKTECFEIPWKNYIACVLFSWNFFPFLPDSLYFGISTANKGLQIFCCTDEKYCNEMEFSTWKRRKSFEYSFISSMKCNSRSKRAKQTVWIKMVRQET